ncbi:MAG: hypothetical protein K2H34_08230 [Lachnospiraceae bacterium]|nr:hypothetical protein [Lachnospiraceae bacterium]
MDEALIEREFEPDKKILQPINAVIAGDEKRPEKDNRVREVHIDKGKHFTGHTKRYVEIKVTSDKNIINEIVAVRIVSVENIAN